MPSKRTRQTGITSLFVTALQALDILATVHQTAHMIRVQPNSPILFPDHMLLIALPEYSEWHCLVLSIQRPFAVTYA